jgi:hypothetical protein
MPHGSSITETLSCISLQHGTPGKLPLLEKIHPSQASLHDLDALRAASPSLPAGCGLFADKAYFYHERRDETSRPFSLISRNSDSSVVDFIIRSGVLPLLRNPTRSSCRSCRRIRPWRHY